MRYMGSKRRIAKYILPIILGYKPAKQWYVEPFVGGCNSIQHVFGPRMANDANPYLVAMWRALTTGWVPPKNITVVEYKHIRSNKNAYTQELVGFVGFCCTFGAKFFASFGRNIKGDDSSGVYKTARKHIMKQIPFLKSIDWYSGSYAELKIPDKSIIYCDPPYAGTAPYKETGNIFKHDNFWEWCRTMKQQGHTVFVSEYNAPIGIECVWKKEIRVGLNNNIVGTTQTECLFKI